MSPEPVPTARSNAPRAAGAGSTVRACQNRAAHGSTADVVPGRGRLKARWRVLCSGRPRMMSGHITSSRGCRTPRCGCAPSRSATCHAGLRRSRPRPTARRPRPSKEPAMVEEAPVEKEPDRRSEGGARALKLKPGDIIRVIVLDGRAILQEPLVAPPTSSAHPTRSSSPGPSPLAPRIHQQRPGLPPCRRCRSVDARRSAGMTPGATTLRVEGVSV